MGINGVEFRPMSRYMAGIPLNRVKDLDCWDEHDRSRRGNIVHVTCHCRFGRSPSGVRDVLHRSSMYWRRTM